MLTVHANDTMLRVAVVGCGQWGKNLARAFAQERVLQGVVDTSSNQAAEVAEYLSLQGFPAPRVLRWDEVLQDLSIAAVVLATPAPTHVSMACSALAAGKHVFIEKPFALSITGARQILEAAKLANKVIMAGHLFQYHSAFIELKAMAHSGTLGRIQHIHSRRLGYGRVREVEDVLWNLASHDISMILALTGEMPIHEEASGFRHLRCNVADVADIALSFASGITAHVLVSWLYPQKERKLIVVGDAATAIFDDCERWEKKLRLFENTIHWQGSTPVAVQKDSQDIALPEQEPLVAECHHFLECLRSGQSPITDREEALRVVQVLSRIEKKCAQGIIESVLDQSTALNYGQNGVARDNISASDRAGFSGRVPRTDTEWPDREMSRRFPTTSHGSETKLLTTGDTCCATNEALPKLISLVDLKPQMSKIEDQLSFRLAKVMNHTRFILGPEVTELETRLANYSGVAHAVTCGNGTAALTLALLALELQTGDAVIIPALSFVATVEPVVLLGGIPIFIDVEAEDLTIDSSLVPKGIAAAAKAGYRAVGIIAVDLYGMPAHYDALHQVARLSGLWIIGDAAQSFGGSLSDRRVGSLAHLTTTSFFPSKPLGCYGDGGAVLTNDAKLAQALRSLRQHGFDETKSNSKRVGLNSRLDSIQAAVLLCKLDLLPNEVLQRDLVAQRYDQLLHGIVRTPKTRKNSQSAWAAYTVLTEHRDFIKQHLHDQGIASAICYSVPLHKHLAYQQFPVLDGVCPVAERASKEVLSLPFSPYLDTTTQTHIVRTVLDALDHIKAASNNPSLDSSTPSV